MVKRLEGAFTKMTEMMEKEGMALPREKEYGKIVRFSSDGSENKNGWYILLENSDGSIGGEFGDWKTNDRKPFIFHPENNDHAKEQNKKDALQIAKGKEEKEKRREMEREMTNKKVAEIWENSESVDHRHPYLRKKNIRPIDIKQCEEKLVVPLFEDFEDLYDQPSSLQFISPDGEKRFKNGGKVKGSFHIIKENSEPDTIYITEGYATGVTVNEATDKPVVVTFNAGNLMAVCEKVKVKYPQADIVIAADNDINTENSNGKNVGKESAKEASLKIGVEYALCPVNSDFNDLYNEFEIQEEGLTAVREKLQQSEPACIYSKIVKEMNSKYAITWLGGKCVVLKETFDMHTGKEDIDFTSDNDLKKYYGNRRVADPENAKKEINVIDYWLKSPDRRQYKGVVFEPGREMPGYYNLWKGFKFNPVKGDWSAFREHIFNIIANGNEHQFDWIMKWMARIVQNPGGDKPGTSIVLRGGKGTGKGVFVNLFGHLLGDYYIQLAQQDQLLGRFNHHLKNKILVFADEGFWAGDKQSEGAIKNMITEPKLVIEQKGKDAITVSNYINLIIGSNNEWVVPAGLQERRFYVADVSTARQQDHEYFKFIIEQMENGGFEAMLYDLLHYDYTLEELRNAPKTNALFDQIVNTLDVTGKFWFERISEGTLSFDDEEWTEKIEVRKLYDEYLEFAKIMKERYPLSPQEFGKSLRNHCPGFRKIRINQAGNRPYVYQFPSLEECRKYIEVQAGLEGQVEWESGPI